MGTACEEGSKARGLVFVHWSSHSERAVAIDVDVHLSLVHLR